MNRPRDRRGARILALLLAAAALAPAVGAEEQPATAAVPPARPPPRLRVSDNGRALVTEDGAPFFWLGDTSWHMMTKAVREDGGDQPSVGRYFDTRAAQGFSVIQTVILPPDGRKGNAYGHRPFADSECSQPLVADGPRNDFWDMTDWLVDAAGARGLYLALLPVWLQDVDDRHPWVKAPKNAYSYGRFLGSRYGARTHMVWVLGGDAWQKGRNVDTPSRLALVRAMAEGIADGANGEKLFDGKADWSTTLMTFHPPGGGHSSSEWLHGEAWLDFHMIQTTTRFNFGNYETVARDYAKEPVKPTLDAEVAYEESLSLTKREPQDRRIAPWDVRRAAYWNVFAGALGHTYGHRSFIAWIRRGETYKWGADTPWYERLDASGAVHMGHLRRLVDEWRAFDRVPDQALIEGEPGRGTSHVRALRDGARRWAMLYIPDGRPIRVRSERLPGPAVDAFWFDPRTGHWSADDKESVVRKPFASGLASGPGTAPREFAPPGGPGEGNDWVLVLLSP